MKVYIQAGKNDFPHNDNFFKAYLGFHEMGFETVFFHDYELLQRSEREDIVVGYVGTVKRRLLDFGVSDDGRTLLIEANDGYALGSYGLFYPQYAKLLSARWAEFTGTKDECDFEMERFDFYEKKEMNNICRNSDWRDL